MEKEKGLIFMDVMPSWPVCCVVVQDLYVIQKEKKNLIMQNLNLS